MNEDILEYLNSTPSPPPTSGGDDILAYLNQPQPAPTSDDILGYLNALPQDPEDNGKGRLRSAGASAMRAGGEQMGQTASFLSRALRTINDLGASVARGGASLGTQSDLEKTIQQDPLYRTGQEISEGAREVYQPNPKYAGEFLTDTLAQGAGGLVPTIAAGLINPGLAIAQGTAVSGQQGAEDAIKSGRPDLANRSAAIGAAVTGLSEPFLGVAGRLAKFANGAGGSMVKTVAKAAGGEAAQEGIEQVGQNLTASTLAGYDQNRGTLEGVPTAMAAGAILGGGVGGLARAVTPTAAQQRGAAAAQLIDQAASDPNAPLFWRPGMPVPKDGPEVVALAPVVPGQSPPGPKYQIDQALGQADGGLVPGLAPLGPQYRSIPTTAEIPAGNPVVPAVGIPTEVNPAAGGSVDAFQRWPVDQQLRDSQAKLATDPQDTTPTPKLAPKKVSETARLAIESMSADLPPLPATAPAVTPAAPTVAETVAPAVPEFAPTVSAQPTVAPEPATLMEAGALAAPLPEPELNPGKKIPEKASKKLTDRRSAAMAAVSTDPTKTADLDAFLRDPRTEALVLSEAANYPEVTGMAEQLRADITDRAVLFLAKNPRIAIGEEGGFPVREAVKKAALDYKKSAYVQRESVTLDEPTITGSQQDIVASGLTPAEQAIQNEEQANEEQMARGFQAILYRRLGLSPEDIAAFRAMLVPGANQSGLNPKARKTVKSKEFEQRFAKTTQEVADKYGIPLRTALQYITRYSAADGQVSGVLTTEQAQAFVQAEFPKIARFVRIVTDPNALMPSGKPWAGRSMVAPNRQPVIDLNLAHIRSPEHLAEVLTEEAVHLVYGDPEVAAAFAALRGTVTDGQLDAQRQAGYGEQELLEEVLVKATVGRFESTRQQAAWRKLVSSIWGAIQRLFGINPSIGMIQDMIVARALSGEAMGTVDESGQATRYSVADQDYRNKVEVEKAKNFAPGADIRTIEEAARAKGSILPQSFIDKLASYRSGPVTPTSPAKSARRQANAVYTRALGYLRPLLGLTELTDQGLNRLPVDQVSPEAADLAHRAIVRGFDQVYRLQQNLDTKLGTLQAQYLAAAGQMADALQADIDGRFAQGASEDMIGLYRDYLQNEVTLARSATTLDGQRIAELERAKKDLGLHHSTLNSAVPVALQAIAKAMPQPGTVTAIRTPQEMVAWLMQQRAAGWPAFGGTQPMNDIAFQFLAVQDPINNIPPAIVAKPDIMDRIDELRRLQDDTAYRTQLKEDMIQAFRGLGGSAKKSITPRQFARQYASWRDQNRIAVETASRIRRQFGLAEERLRGAILAIDDLEKLRADPEFGRQVRVAANLSEVVTDGVITEAPDGSMRFLNPGQPVGSQDKDSYTVFSLAPNPQDVANNATKAVAFLAALEKWRTTNPANPKLEGTYEYAERLIGRYMLNSLGTLNLTGNQGLVPFTADWWWSLPKHVVGTISLIGPGSVVVSKVNDLVSMIAPGTKARIGIVRQLGGQASKIAFDFLGRTDKSDQTIRNAEANREYGVQAQKLARLRQMKEHGLDIGGRYVGESVAIYAEEVLDPLIASRQNPSQTKLGVGDWTPFGRQIRAGDIELALKEKAYKDYFHAAVRTGEASKLSTFGVRDEGYSRKAASYDMKSERGTSSWAEEFAPKWRRAAEQDATAKSTANRMALLADGRNFNGAVNGEVLESSIEYTRLDPKDPQYQAYRNRAGNKTANPTFTGLDEFLDWMADERTRIITATRGPGTTNVPQERTAALSRLLSDIDETTTRIVQRDRKDIELDSGPLTGVGKTVADVITGQSSFTNQRGGMVGPSTYYNYSIALDSDRLKYNGAYKLVFQKREMDAYQSATNALILERNRQRDEQKAWVEARPKSPKILERWRFRAQQQEEVKAGRRIATLKALDELITVMQQTIQGMKSNMESARVYDAGVLRMGRRLESASSVSKLASAPVVSTNLISAIWIQPLINDLAMARGRYNVLRSLTTGVGLGVRAAHNMMRAATAMVTDRRLKAALARNPDAWLGVARGIHDWTQKYTADRDYLLEAGWADSDTLREAVGRWWTDTITMSKTSGATTRHDGSMTEMVINAVLSPLSLAAVLGGELNAAGERFGSVVQLQHYRARLNAMRADVVRAFRLREQTEPGWDDTSKPLRPFLPEEIGFQDNKGLSWFRDMVAPVGTLENAMLDYYQRHKAALAAGKNPLQEELFGPEQMGQALFGMQKFGNVISDSGRGDATHGKGWTGAARAAFFRFTNYGIQLNELVRQAMRPDPRDAGGLGRTKEAVALLGLFGALAALALLALGSGQMLRELQTGRVPATATIGQLADDPSATAFYRAYLAGGANLFMPTYGEHINSILTGQQGRNLTDLTAMVPGIGAASQLIGFAREVAQTGDAYYPALKFTQSILPISQVVTGSTQGGQADLQALNAIRSLRSAAPTDMELRGQGARMSELTPLVRDAQRALARDDQSGYRTALQGAIRYSMARGIPETQAIRSFASAVRGRDPQRTVFGRTLEPAELQRVTARMSPTQRSAFDASQRATNRLKVWSRPKSRRPKRPASALSRLKSQRKKRKLAAAYQ